MIRVIFSFIVISFLLISPLQAEENSCDKILELGFNVYKLYSEAQINESYYLMLSKSEKELDKLANKYEKGDKLDGAYKMIAVAWSKNRKDEKYKERFRSSKFRYNAGLSIDNRFFEYIKIRTVNEETLSAWQKCKSNEILAKQKMKELELKSGGFIPEVVGDEAGVFTFVINKLPQEGHPSKVKIVNVTKSNIEFIGDYNLKAEEFVENYTGISQSMRLIDPTEEATLVVNLENYNPVSKRFNKNALSNFPLGSIITSVLDFNQFSYETKNHRNNEFDPSKSKWAPADGRKVTGSDYAKYNNFVPDLRGQFLRGANIIFSTNEPTMYVNGKDPDTRNVIEKYSYQGQSTKLPNNRFTGATNVTGNHSHSFTAITARGSSQNIPNAHGPQVNNGGGTTSATGNHSHTVVVNAGGDRETRPRNMTVFYYIRINK